MRSRRETSAISPDERYEIDRQMARGVIDAGRAGALARPAWLPGPRRAAGIRNNVVLSRNGQRVLVKGRTYKELMPAESGDETTAVEREVLRTSVTVLDLASDTIEIVDQGAAAHATEQRAA